MTYGPRKVSREDMDQHRCEKCNCIISMFEGYRCAGCKKKKKIHRDEDVQFPLDLQWPKPMRIDTTSLNSPYETFEEY